MEIRELKKYTQQEFTELKRLMSELTERINLEEKVLEAVLKDTNSHLYTLRDQEKIIGCATLCIFHSPTGCKASIEDVVISTDYRGKHLGRLLMNHLLKEAQLLAPIEIQLTSKPQRIPANGLYQTLGFQRKETNVYRMTISPNKNNIEPIS